MKTDETTLLGLLVAHAERRPHDIFAREVSGATATCAQMVDGARRWASAFRRSGVDHGDHVVTMRLNSIDAQLGWLGLSLAGAVETPINTDYRGGMLVHAVNVARARVLLIEERYADRIAEAASGFDTVQTVVVTDGYADLPFEVVDGRELLASQDPIADVVLPRAWDIASVLFTSGTTGPSKGVRIPWGQLHATACATFPIRDLGPDDVIYNAGPTYHVGAKVMPFIAALCGGQQVVAPFISLTELGSHYLEHGVTTGVVVPSWMADDPDPARTLRNVLVPWRVAWIDEFKRRFGCRSFGAYNMTELSIPIADPGWDAARYDADGRMSCGVLRPGYPGYELRIVDEHDQPVPQGSAGELIVRASAPWTLNAGYLNMPDATAQAWRNGWFHTGDLFQQDDDGYFYFLDRAKDCIRRRGENISSFEVEAHVSDHPSIKECAAVAVKLSEEPAADEEVKVYVILEPDHTLEPGDLIAWLIPRMPRFMIPRYVEFATDLPRTPTMKVRKLELRQAGLTEATWDRVSAGIEIPREP